MCFSKRTDMITRRPSDGGSGLDRPAPQDDTVLVVVNLDPHRTREATVWLDLPALGVDGEFIVTDELTGASYWWGRGQLRPAEPGDPARPHLHRHAQRIARHTSPDQEDYSGSG